MEYEFFLDALFEGQALLEGQRIGFCDDGDDIDDIGKLLKNDDVNRFEADNGQ